MINPRAIPREVWWLVTATLVLSPLTANPGLTASGILLVPVFFALLRRSGEPPALLFAAGYQWLQVFTPVVNANVAGMQMAEAPLAPNLDVAAYLGMLALLFLAFGMRIGRGRRRLDLRDAALRDGVPFSVWKLLVAYAGAHAVSAGAVMLGGMVGGLRQPLMVLDTLKTSVVFLILWAGLRDRRFRPLAGTVVAIEIFLGFMGFFSGFKEVLFLGIVAALTVSVDLRRLLRPKVMVIAGATIMASVVWQAIKVDYRDFLNQGTRQQVVLVSPVARLTYLANRLVSLTSEDLRRGLESGVQRTGYLEFFGHTIATVPARVPYQEGRLWGEAIMHVLTPRLLFPNKAAVNDSDRVNEFSGITVAGADQGTSISLGYVAESYIDFGPYLMHVPVLLLGVLWGWSYRTLATTGRRRLLSLAFAVSFVLSGAILFESSNIKIVGGAITTLLVGWVLLRYGSRWIWSVMAARRYQAPRVA